MNKPLLIGAMCATVFSIISMSSHAALIDRGGGLIYDDVLDVTWLQDANYAKTNGDDADGFMDWAVADTWAANLSYYDSVRDVTYDDWRLPTALNQNGSGPCFGFNCADSEMGHLFYVDFGATDHTTVHTTGNPTELAKFTNIQDDGYWSGTVFNSSQSWDFDFKNGSQNLVGNVNVNVLAWAVRSGDVSAVPVPAAIWLFGSGLLGLIGISTRRGTL
jgi:hypothetical protein